MSKQSLQFKISLNDITPKNWRCLLVPANYTFWDMHCAIGLEDDEKFDPSFFDLTEVGFAILKQRYESICVIKKCTDRTVL